jgi:hypothetical protein
VRIRHAATQAVFNTREPGDADGEFWLLRDDCGGALTRHFAKADA